MSLSVQDILELDVARGVRVLAGLGGLTREVRWVHIWPEVLPWFHGPELLLTTGHSWPAEARALKAHWNTMRHRIARIEAILERPLADPQLRLHLQLALEVERAVPSLPR